VGNIFTILWWSSAPGVFPGDYRDHMISIRRLPAAYSIIGIVLTHQLNHSHFFHYELGNLFYGKIPPQNELGTALFPF